MDKRLAFLFCFFLKNLILNPFYQEVLYTINCEKRNK